MDLLQNLSAFRLSLQFHSPLNNHHIFSKDLLDKGSCFSLSDIKFKLNEKASLCCPVNFVVVILKLNLWDLDTPLNMIQALGSRHSWSDLDITLSFRVIEECSPKATTFFPKSAAIAWHSSIFLYAGVEVVLKWFVKADY